MGMVNLNRYTLKFFYHIFINHRYTFTMKTIFYIISIILITNLGASVADEKKKQFEEDCNNGKTISCYNMGLMYDYGDGVDEDDEKALDFYIKACDKNYYTGCTKAALIYEESKTVKENKKEALKLYTKACGGGDGFACHYVALDYSKRKTKAMKNISIGLYTQACENGYAPSCIYLGRMYRDSRAVTRDLEKAKEMFNLACEENNHLGCKELRILEELEKSGY